jgi:sugar lactone lactonase YvrE
VGPTGEPVFYAGGFTLWRIDSDGFVRRVAGTGSFCFPCGSSHVEGGDALTQPIGAVDDVAFGPDGSLYFTEGALHRVRRVTADGRMEMVAGLVEPTSGGGSCTGGPSTSTGAATAVALNTPSSVAVSRDGTVYIGSNTTCSIHQVGTDAQISTAMHEAGSIFSVRDLAIGPRGDVFFIGNRAFGPSGLFRLTGASTTSVAVGGEGAFSPPQNGESATDSP